jgi:hypothetical protein
MICSILALSAALTAPHSNPRVDLMLPASEGLPSGLEIGEKTVYQMLTEGTPATNQFCQSMSVPSPLPNLCVCVLWTLIATAAATLEQSVYFVELGACVRVLQALGTAVSAQPSTDPEKGPFVRLEATSQHHHRHLYVSLPRSVMQGLLGTPSRIRP